MNENLTAMVCSTGLHFQMEKLIPANSFQAHRFLHLAKDFGKQDDLKERLLKARFEEGADIGDVSQLENFAKEVGISEEAIHELRTTTKFEAEVRSDERTASDLGIQGVPFFVFNRKFALSEARHVEDFRVTIKKAGESARPSP